VRTYFTAASVDLRPRNPRRDVGGAAPAWGTPPSAPGTANQAKAFPAQCINVFALTCVPTDVARINARSRTHFDAVHLALANNFIDPVSDLALDELPRLINATNEFQGESQQ
jgi:hypothetical protein